MWDTDNTNLFGDDAGFLSWLGIAVETKEVEEKEEIVEQEVEEVEEAIAADKPKLNAKVIKKAEPAPKPEKKKAPKSHKAPKNKPVKWNITLTQTEAPAKRKPKVIDFGGGSKNAPAAKIISKSPKKKDTSDIDALIKKKSGGDYMGNLEWRGGSRRTPSSGGTTKWFVRRWWGGWGRGRGGRWWGRGGFGRDGWPRVDDGKLQLGRTSHGSTTSMKDIIASQTKREKTYKVSGDLKRKETVSVGETITVKEFSEKMWVPLGEVMKVLLTNKIVVAAQASIDFDTAQLVGTEFEVTVERESVEMKVEDLIDANLESILAQDKEADDLIERPPVVTVMGHVDHGKTRLLDHLRGSDIVWWEAGGITQSIWASQIIHSDKKITFIDTPWHELFSAIRARWSKITNIVIIVVAADDGVKPQTVEAIRHAKDAGAPIVVAITKMDLWLKNLEQIKWQLAEHELTPEDRWGDTMIVPCSAVSGQGIDDLLEAILLQAEMLNLRYSPSRPAVWVVVESNKSAQQWVMTTLLVMTGTLKIWDIVAIHDTYGRVKRMSNRKWEQIKEAHWWDAVMVLGINNVPEPGRMLEVVASDREAQKKIALIQEHAAKHKGEVALQSVLDRLGTGETAQLKLIIKADSYGSLEAVKHSISKANLEENVEVKVIHDDVGNITDSDISFAKAGNALVIWFNLPITWAIKKKADQHQVTVKQFDIIYEFIEYIEDVSEWLIEIEKVETLIGKMEVLALFYRKWKDMIVWGKVTEGRAQNHATFKVMKWEDQYSNGKITSLQREQDSVKEVKEGYECGIRVRASKKIEIGDVIEFYIMEVPEREPRKRERKGSE